MPNQTICPEIVEKMTAYEKEQLMDELTTLLQNQSVTIEVSQRKGFQWLWRVLTGKQQKAQNQIMLDQQEINRIVYQLLPTLNRELVEMKEKNNDHESRIIFLEKITALHSLYLMRFGQEIADLGGGVVAIEPLKDHVNSMKTSPQPHNPGLVIPELPGEHVIHPTDSKPLDSNDEIRRLASTAIRNGADFEDFIRTAQFRALQIDFGTVDLHIYWDTIFTIDNWQIQQWCSPVTGRRGHYRILDSTKTRRAWSNDGDEMIRNLEFYLQSK